MKKMPTIYKRDSKGEIREWRIEVDEDKYRVIAGLQKGKQVVSEWTVCTPKNIGKVNATIANEQALLEAEALYKKKLEGEYHKELSEVDKPKWFKPMLAQNWDKRKGKISYPVWVQSKIDGIRALLSKDGAFSRTGKEIIAIPHIQKTLKPFFEKHPDAVLDGELYNHEYKSDFNSLVSAIRKTKPKKEDLDHSEKIVQYHVYDFPSCGEKFSQRLKLLKEEFSDFDFGDTIQVLETKLATNEVEVDELYGKFLEEGYEGGIIRLDAPYEQKRSNNLLKRKDFEDDEFEILDIEEGKGNWSGIAKVVKCRGRDGIQFGATIKGSQEIGREILAQKNEYVGKQVTVQYFTKTPDGVPRFPVAKVLHKEKRW